MDRVFRDAVVQSASTPSTPIPPHAVRTTRRRAEFAVRLKLRSRSRQTRHDCSLSDATQRIRNRRLHSARLNEACFPAPKQARAINAIPSPTNRQNLPPTQRSRPTHEFDLDLILQDARQPTQANPSATANSREIRLLFDPLYVPIAKESREKPHSNPLHGSLPSGLPSQDDFRGHGTPNEVRRFIAHLSADEAAQLDREALAQEERTTIERMLADIRRLPPDTKAEKLAEELRSLRAAGYPQTMVFTQYTDTMDFLRVRLAREPDLRIMCFSGRGGEVRENDGTWRTVTREAAKRHFREGKADVLLCTDAAAEGINFQFCGSLVNYDMPWNPMRVEQRIGRIDRLGQKHPVIRIVNLHYSDTVEADVYLALRKRISLFTSVVGRLQPILARMPGIIAQTVLSGKGASKDATRWWVIWSRWRRRRKQAASISMDLWMPNLPSRPGRSRRSAWRI